MRMFDTRLRNGRSGTRIRACMAALAAGLAGCAGPAPWPQWGGPNRNFTVETKELADTWPEEGPPRLWHRDLGDGNSTIVADGGVLYTMYRVDADEFTVALDAETGETVWEHRNPSPFTPTMEEHGPGPHSTPLIVGPRLYTVGANAVLHCFDKKSGRVLWKHDLVEEFGAPLPDYGYASSALAYENTIIIPVDRKRPEEPGDASADGDEPPGEQPQEVEGQSLMAFDQVTGDVLWKAQDLQISYSSPILISLDGEAQLVVFTAEEVVGLDPDGGALLWRHPHPTQYGGNLSTPVWDGKDLIFVSAAYGSGSRVIQLTGQGSQTIPTELWHSRKMRVHHANAVIIGDHIYGSSGDFGAAFFMGVHLRTGKIAWRERGLAKATCVYADGKLIILDEDGQLALATVTPDGLTVHARCTVAERTAWAAPTLVRTTLYLRDRKHIMAFDLG